MSQENVEAFKRAFEAINRRDVETLLEELDSEVCPRYTVRSPPSAIGMPNTTVAIGRMRARGTASGAETESPIGSVAEFKNGRGLRSQTYFDPKEALEAAGLSE